MNQVEIFNYLDIDRQEDIARHLELVEYCDGEQIIIQGHISKGFFIIEDGNKERNFSFCIMIVF